MCRLDLENAEKPEIKLPTSAGSWKKQESSRKTSTSALWTMPKPLTMWTTRNWKILEEMGIQDHLTCLLRNLYAGQEATVRTGHGTTDWFQIGKGVLDRGWDGWVASPTQWIWIWVNSRSWWWTGRPGMLRSMGSQRVGHDWVT